MSINKNFLKTIKKTALVAAVMLVCVMLTGCGASLTVYDYTENGRRVNEYELNIEAKLVENMERSAITDSNGKKYTVPDYFYSLFNRIGYSLEDASMTSEGYYARFKKTFAEGTTPELFAVGSTVEYSLDYKSNPFTRRYSRVSENPFNGVRAAYDEVRPGQSGQIIQQLKNGIVAVNEYGETEVLFPSVTDAFPYLNGIDTDGLLLNYATVGSSRMDSSGRKIEGDSKNALYVFSRYFDNTDTTIEFEFNRPVPYGWYLVALAAGGIVVAVFVLVTREKKQKPTLLDRFPYNPEEYRDYESHLPTKIR
ncbi:MAG: hypothetical protein J1F39_01860 [Clostridiales bacterium]|nr:hypothetical protein [Clostridiales bacterium]